MGCKKYKIQDYFYFNNDTYDAPKQSPIQIDIVDATRPYVYDSYGQI